MRPKKYLQEHVYSLAAVLSLSGVKDVVMSPGSRSAPLVFAFGKNRSFELHTVADERSAAYFALGIAQQTQKPVVVFCTSGTAAANYLPAVTEAFYQRIPLIVITADRPEALLNQQDGQMINQRNLFGSHVRMFCQLNGGNESNTVKQVGEAVLTSIQKSGPVHINMPFEEPLYPEKAVADHSRKYETEAKKWVERNLKVQPDSTNPVAFDSLEKAWVGSPKKIILIGQSMIQEKWITSLVKLQQQNDVVILTDVVSNKFQFCTAPHFDKLISSSNDRILQTLQPGLIVSFGGPMLSKSLKNWLKKQKPEHHFRIQTEEENIDTYSNVTEVIKHKPAEVLSHLAEISWNEKQDSSFVDSWKNADDLIRKKIDGFISKNNWSEMHAAYLVLKSLPEGCNLQLANSSVVRYVSLLGNIDSSWIINSNRGTSGIDGCTSTAVGAAKCNLRPTVLLTGDLAFLYDKNGLWHNELPGNLRIVVFNNNGGGIFTLIDGPSKHKAFEKYFTTPTPQSIKLTAQLSGLDHYFCSNKAALTKTLNEFMNPENNKASVLEIKFDMKDNARAFHQFKNIKI